MSNDTTKHNADTPSPAADCSEFSPEDQFLAYCASQCDCEGTICGSVLQGGPCEHIMQIREYDP